MKNPYEVLGVSETATDEEVKTAYRNMAKKYHPDNYTDSPLADVAEEKMKEINEAYDTICDMRRNGAQSSSYSGSYGSGSSYRQTSRRAPVYYERQIGRRDGAAQRCSRGQPQCGVVFFDGHGVLSQGLDRSGIQLFSACLPDGPRQSRVPGGI